MYSSLILGLNLKLLKILKFKNRYVILNKILETDIWSKIIKNKLLYIYIIIWSNIIFILNYFIYMKLFIILNNILINIICIKLFTYMNNVI